MTSPVTSSTRHLTASMVVIDPATEKVLLVGHKASGWHQFPGGHLETDQDPGQAALREVWEETGIHATMARQTRLDLPGMTQLANPWLSFEIPAPAKPHRGDGKPEEPAHHHLDLLFIGTADSRLPLQAQEEEVTAAVWIPIADLDYFDSARAEVPQIARLALAELRAGHSNTGLRISGAGSVTISGSAFGHNATVIN